MIKPCRAYILFFICCLAGAQQLLSQDFIADFKKINAIYQDSSYRMRLTYNYYNEVKSKRPDEVHRSEVRKSGDNYYVDLHQTRTIINQGVFFQINHEFKVVMLDSARPAYYKTLGVNLDSLARFYKGVTFKALDSFTGEYTIPSQGKGIAYSKVVFDRRTHLLREVTIQFLDQRKTASKGALRNRLNIKYEEVDLSPGFSAKSFSQSAFIYKKGSSYKLKKPYVGYHLVSNL